MSHIKRNRKLIDQDVFSENAWDDIEWTVEMVNEADRRIQEQIEESKRNEIDALISEIDTQQKWDIFYKSHADKFFKDRRWILSELPEIIPYMEGSRGPCRILEAGCGVGNAATQFVSANKGNNFHMYCCDISQNAINVLKTREFYRLNDNIVTAFQADLTKDIETKIRAEVQPQSLNLITLIFTLSSLRPDDMRETVKNLSLLLKPGGMIFFRDYARYDLTQLRFKGRSYLGENFYVRADGTTSYFFTKELIRDIFTNAGLQEIELKDDNRLLVNRLKSIRMRRCWLQAKFMRPESGSSKN